MKLLQDKKALITGGSRGIGAAIARQFAAEGASVALTYVGDPSPARAVAEEITTSGGSARALPVDLGDSGSIAALFASVDDLFDGELDVLVNNASVQANKPIDECDLEDYDKLFGVNVRGTFDLTRHAVGRLRDNGRIITVGACLADRTIVPGMALYAGSKAANAAFCRGWSQDLGSRGITANCVQPGPIDTDMNPDSEQNPISRMLNEATTLKRYGTSEEVASLVTYIASAGSQYITGEVINIDGGLNA